jgi:uncharacterized protein YndB with AHSA1/START domain
MNDRLSPDADHALAGRTLIITRLFNAPPAAVFRAFTDPQQMLQWYGPRHHPATHVQADARPGGTFRVCLRSQADGRELRHGGTYREVVPDRRLVFTFAWDREHGMGPETLVTIDFEDRGGKTLMTFHQSVFDTTENRDGHVQGWTSAFDRLDDLLAVE